MKKLLLYIIYNILYLTRLHSNIYNSSLFKSFLFLNISAIFLVFNSIYELLLNM